MTKFMGLEFAPFDIPVERRLQTLALLYFTSSFLFKGYCGIFIFLFVLLYTHFWYLSVLYVFWYWYDYKTCERGGRRSTWIRNWRIWNHMKDYFPARLVKTAELDPNKNYVCGYHPHGIFCAGAFASFGTEALGFSAKYRNIRPYLLTLQGQFRFPLYREFLMGAGLCSISRDSIHWLLNNEGKGNMIVIVVGGAMEALDAHRGTDVRLTLRNRRGFVRIALRNGASLLPMFSFGENDLYEQLSNPEGSYVRRVQNFITKFVGVSPPIFHGRGVFQYNFGYLPYRRPMDIIVGKPIDVEQSDNPTEAQVDHYHKLYVESLTKLFDEHKIHYDSYKDAALIV